MMLRHLAAIACLVLISACTEQGVVYKAPIAEARQTLLATGLPPLVFGSQPPDVEAQADGSSQITWIARRNGEELFRYVAHLSGEGDGATRVKLEMKAGANYAQKLAEHPKIADMYLVAMDEQVASALEHRAFNMARIYPSLTAATMENMGGLRASVDQAAAASEKSDRDNIAKAYADEAAGRR
ncbi:MAG: hypothetical protein JWP35_1083 [Caulobacter sp.]|jgi:hypothetical protein|nr:hypothetical protein [Caulobacter sp.]